jgi:aquaporin Z
VAQAVPVRVRPSAPHTSLKQSEILHKTGFDVVASGFATNGYGAHSPGGYSLGAALLAEIVMTYVFLLIILGATDKHAPVGFAGLAIGFALVLIHLISIPVTNTSVNPARSTAPAIFVGGWALGQLWLFWVAPIIGAVLAGMTYRWLGAHFEIIAGETKRGEPIHEP